jgi:hypothetical protein
MSSTRGERLRDWLVRFLFASTALQSFDGLVQRAAKYHQFGSPPGVAAEWLPRLWAATVDAIWYAGLLGIQRHGGRDRLSWLMFVVAFGASVGFQVINATDMPVAAVAPVSLLLVLIVMHAPRRSPAEVEPEVAVAPEPSTGNLEAASVATPPTAERRVRDGASEPTAVPDRRAFPARPVVPVEARPDRREQPVGAGLQNVPAVPAHQTRADAVADPDQTMRAHWAAERSRGRTPSGAELDRVVGRNPDNGAGRKARSRYLREEAEGRFTAPTSGVPGPAPASIPAEPVPAGTTADRTPAQIVAGPAAAPRPGWPADPATTAGNGGPARPVIVGAFPARRADRERSDA